ncbi:MAG: hypothetical protein ACTHOH_18855 [Lysobacteraceae bacterium]
MTPHALRLLGLGTDADERAIKRAYATRLKATRPDEDPEGFQRLNEAYQSALQWAKQQPARPAPPPIADPVIETTAEALAVSVVPDTETPPISDGGTTFRFQAPPLQSSWPSPPPVPHLQVRPVDDAADEADDDEAPPAPTRLRISTVPPAAGGAGETPPVASPAPRLRVSEAAPPPPPTEDAPPWRRLRVSSARLDTPPEAHGTALPEDEVPFDPARFHRECLALAANGTRTEFDAWLRAQPALWSIARKAALGRGLFDLLRTQLPPVPEAQFATLAAFFAIDDVHSGYDPLVVQQLRTTLHDAWSVARDRAGDGPIEIPLKRGWPVYGAARTAVARTTLERRQREKVVAQLAAARHPELLRRWSWWRMFRNVLSRQRVAEVVAAVEGLGDAPGDRFDPRALRFWRQAADETRWSWPHTFLVFSRCLAVALAIVGILVVITLPIVIGENEWGIYAAIAGAITAISFSGWLAYAAIRHFTRWQAEDDPPAGASRWLHRAAVPLLALSGIGINLSRTVDAAAIAVLLFATIVSIRRQSARNGTLLPHIDWDAQAGWSLLRLVVLLVTLGVLSQLAVFEEGGPPFCFALAGLALLFWGIDLVRQRPRAPR